MSDFIITGTVTYAMKAARILKQHGFHAEALKSTALGEGYGCGYGVRVRGSIEAAEALLRKNGVKILGIGRYGK